MIVWMHLRQTNTNTHTYTRKARTNATSRILPHRHGDLSHRVHLHLKQRVLPNEILERIRELKRVQEGKPRHGGLDVILAPPHYEGPSEDRDASSHDLDSHVEPPSKAGGDGRRVRPDEEGQALQKKKSFIRNLLLNPPPLGARKINDLPKHIARKTQGSPRT